MNQTIYIPSVVATIIALALLFMGIIANKTQAAGADDFVTTWQTISNNETITIPTNGSYTYNYAVDWGDGNTDTGVTGDGIHTYATPGTYTVRISGTFPQIYFNNGGDKDKIQTIEQWGTGAWASFQASFRGAGSVVSNATDAPDLSGVTDASNAFENASALAGNFNNWDTTNITNMANMFAGAAQFNSSLNNWNVTGVTNMINMFGGAAQFNSDLDTWNVSSVLDHSRMFDGATNFNGDVTTWSPASSTNMRVMFRNATAFNQDISGWDVSQVQDMDTMFFGATAFDQNLSTWDVSNVADMNNMFRNVTLSTDNYDAMLTAWSALSLQNNVTLTAGDGTYCAASTQRQSIIDTYTWTITDGGSVNTCFDYAFEIVDDVFILEDHLPLALSNNLFENGVLPAIAASGTVAATTSVTFAIGGSADAADYTYTGTTTVTIPPGNYTGDVLTLPNTVNLTVNADTVSEGHDTIIFSVVSVGPGILFDDLDGDGTISSTTFTYTIYDDDVDISQTDTTSSSDYLTGNFSTTSPTTIDFNKYILITDDQFTTEPDFFDGSRGLWSKGQRWDDTILNGLESTYLHSQLRTANGDLLGLDPYSVENGQLVIRAKPIPVSKINDVHSAINNSDPRIEYYSGSMTTRESWGSTYGYYETRAKMPLGQGHWPAFWLTNSTQTWPPEIDIFEFLGREATSDLHATIHYNSAPPVDSSLPNYALLDYNPYSFHRDTGLPQPSVYRAADRRAMGNTITLSDEFGSDIDVFNNFYIYATEWNANEIIFYFGTTSDALHEVYRTPTPEDHHSPMHAIFNNQIGGNWPFAPDPANDAVVFADDNGFAADYIKIYALKPDATVITASGGVATGGSEASTINGTAADEVFTPGGGLDVITLGGGEDAIIVDESPKYEENNNIIYGFGADDVLVVNGFSTGKNDLTTTEDLTGQLFQNGNDTWLRLGLDPAFGEFNPQTVVFKDTAISIFKPESFQFATYDSGAPKAADMNYTTIVSARQASLTGGAGTTSVTHANETDIDNSGVNDAFEANNATLKNVVVGGDAYNTLSTYFTGSQITSFTNLTEDTLTEDTEYDYPLGLFDFEVEVVTHVATGTTETVIIYLDQAYDTSQWVYRKYDATGGTYTTIDNVAYGTAVVDGVTVTTVTYEVVDNGPLDDDTRLGYIKDPAGPGLPPDTTLTSTSTTNTNTSSGGSSGGGSSSRSDDENDDETEDEAVTMATLRDEVSRLRAVLTQLKNRQAGSSGVSGPFTKDLKKDATDSEVLALQQFLNQQGYTVAQSGAGAPGFETNYFGERTRVALARFQTAYSIDPAVGYFGPITRAQVNALLQGQTTAPVSVTPPVTTISPSTTVGPFTYDIPQGTRDPMVYQLQRFLNATGFPVAANGEGGSPGLETDYYGEATRSAVARFQAAYGIEPAVGYFGPITRATINGIVQS